MLDMSKMKNLLIDNIDADLSQMSELNVSVDMLIDNQRDKEWHQCLETAVTPEMVCRLCVALLLCQTEQELVIKLLTQSIIIENVRQHWL